MNTLTIGGIITNAIAIGLKNMASLVGAVVLWVLTLWIPYLNVGTTIGLYSIVIAMSKGQVFTPTEIFDPKYRKYIGEFFLLMAFMFFGITMGYLFFIIPGLVISIAWGQALYIMFDKEKTPLECLTLSNKITYGKKWTIFLGQFILVIGLYIALFVISYIISLISDALGLLILVAGYVALISVLLGAAAYIYSVLRQELDVQTV